MENQTKSRPNSAKFLASLAISYLNIADFRWYQNLSQIFHDLKVALLATFQLKIAYFKYQNPKSELKNEKSKEISYFTAKYRRF